MDHVWTSSVVDAVSDGQLTWTSLTRELVSDEGNFVEIGTTWSVKIRPANKMTWTSYSRQNVGLRERIQCCHSGQRA
jgi:hypothetical protein